MCVVRIDLLEMTKQFKLTVTQFVSDDFESQFEVGISDM